MRDHFDGRSEQQVRFRIVLGAFRALPVTPLVRPHPHTLVDVSRAIENNLDREEQDFSLEVASVGVGTPLKMIRQYKKNVGRTLIVTTNTEKIEAELVEANDVFIILSWKAREPKKVGKGKETVQKEQQIPYTEIKEAVVTVTF